MNSLVLGSQDQFESIVNDPSVIVRNSTAGSEYITAAYRGGELVAERVMHLKQVEHFIVHKPRQAARTAVNIKGN